MGRHTAEMSRDGWGTSWSSLAVLSLALLAGCNPGGDSPGPSDVPESVDVTSTAPDSVDNGVTTAAVEGELPEGLETIYPECVEAGNGCVLRAHLTFAPEGEELRAYAVDLVEEGDGEGRMGQTFITGSGVVVLDPEDRLRWNSPMEMQGGYGATELATDSTGHLFASFAVTNHTGRAWVVDVASTPPRTFETIGPDPDVLVNGWTEPRDGRRELWSEWYSWLDDRAHEPGLNKDLYAWDDSDGKYVFSGCQDGDDVSTRVEAGSSGCETPHGGDRAKVELGEERIGAVALGLLPEAQLEALTPVLGESHDVFDEPGCPFAGPERRHKGVRWGDLTVWGEGHLDDTTLTTWTLSGPDTPVPVTTPFDTEVGMTAEEVLDDGQGIVDTDDPAWGRSLTAGDFWWIIDDSGVVTSINSGDRYFCD